MKNIKKLILLTTALLTTQHSFAMLDRAKEEYAKLKRHIRKQPAQGGEQRKYATQIRDEKNIEIPAKGKKLNMALIDAIKAGKPNIATVKVYLDAGADVDWTDRAHDYPFSARQSAEGYVKTDATPERLAIRKLIREIGPERLAQDLIAAIKKGDEAEVKNLISKGANPKLSVKGKDAWAVLQSEEVLRKVDATKREKIKTLLKSAQ